MLRKERPETKIIVCEPEDAATLSSGIRQQGNPDGPAAASHPAWHPNVMQGWNPDLLAKLVEDAADMRLIDEVLLVSKPDAIHCSQELARKQGIFVGITSGATFSAAL